MCLICVQFEQGKLTIDEAHNALIELVNTEEISLDHATDIYDYLDTIERQRVAQEIRLKIAGVNITPIPDDLIIDFKLDTSNK